MQKWDVRNVSLTQDSRGPWVTWEQNHIQLSSLSPVSFLSLFSSSFSLFICHTGLVYIAGNKSS